MHLHTQASRTVKTLNQSLSWLHRGVSEIFPDRPDSDDKDENLVARLQSADRPLRVKLGIDPTGADIHLGHSIPVRKLRAFQDAGHTAVLIIGDFTARIGDPTGKSEVRRQLTPDEVQHNAETYLDQVRSILDFDTPWAARNSLQLGMVISVGFGKNSRTVGNHDGGTDVGKGGFCRSLLPRQSHLSARVSLPPNAGLRFGGGTG